MEQVKDVLELVKLRDRQKFLCDLLANFIC